MPKTSSNLKTKGSQAHSKNSIPKYKTLILALLLPLALKTQTLEIEKKKTELSQYSLLNRIINAIEIKLHAGFGAGYFLSQLDPINPIYSPYTIRDRFSLSVSINISKILDNSTYKIKKIELAELERKLQQEKYLLNEKLNLVRKKIEIQKKIVETLKINFNEGKTSLLSVLNAEMNLLELQNAEIEILEKLKNKMEDQQ